MDDKSAYKVPNRVEANASDEKVYYTKKAPFLGAFFVLI
jgi:hypothetical protein